MEINRLKWAIRRGMLELDLIFEPFVERGYPRLSESDKALFIRLLECEDQDLFKWFLKHEQPDDKDLMKIVDIIQVSNSEIKPR